MKGRLSAQCRHQQGRLAPVGRESLADAQNIFGHRRCLAPFTSADQCRSNDQVHDSDSRLFFSHPSVCVAPLIITTSLLLLSSSSIRILSAYKFDHASRSISWRESGNLMTTDGSNFHMFRHKIQ